MPKVLEPVCAECHVEGGFAGHVPFRVTVGDPVATVLSAVREVDPGDVLQSNILRKPRGDVAHGGGQRIVPGSLEEGVLIEWLNRLTAPGCAKPGGGGPRPTTGEGLYSAFCASCHGTDARGLADAGPSIACTRSIHGPVREGRPDATPPMPSFPDLTDPEIALIQGHLRNLCPPGAVSGQDLYRDNCATCHGAEAGGDGDAPNVRCATRVADAMDVGRGPAMPAFPTIVGADRTALAGHLALLCAEHGRTAAELWASNCTTCHGATAHGGENALGISGPDIACTGSGDYDEKVRFGDDDMPAFPALANDAGSIASYVHAAFCAGD
jgi:mono/diheme cytochrome c family protein